MPTYTRDVQSLPVTSPHDTPPSAGATTVVLASTAVVGLILVGRAAWLRAAGRRFAAVRGPRFERADTPRAPSTDVHPARPRSAPARSASPGAAVSHGTATAEAAS